MSILGQLAALSDYSPDAGFPSVGGDTAQAAAEAAAARTARGVRRQQAEGGPRAERVMGALADLSMAVGEPITTLTDASRAATGTGPITEEQAFRQNQVGKGVAQLGALMAPGQLPFGAAPSQAVLRGGQLTAGRDPRLWSPISDIKLSKPLDEMAHRYTDVRTPVTKFVQPEDLIGSYGIFTPWDISAANKTLTHVDDVKLQRAVPLRGGPGFQEANPGQAAASDVAISRRLDNQAAALAERTGKPVTIWPITMSPAGGADASHHVADPLAQMIQTAKITRKDAKAFDEVMRETVPDWVGIKSRGDRFPDYISNLESGMKIKARMADRAALAEWQAKGFPDVAAIRHAVSEPGLIDVPRNTTGMTIARYTPGQGLLQTTHPSYPKGVAGQYMGQLASLVPFEAAAPSIAEGLARVNAANKAMGKKVDIQPRYHFEKPTPGVPIEQYFDEAWAENIRRLWGDIK